MEKYIVALDQGTTSCRALLFDQECHIQGLSQSEFSQLYPQQGWVEHDPEEIWEKQWARFHELVTQNQLQPEQIAGIGITNQRETTLVWEKSSGRPIHNAIVWQDKRTAAYCKELKNSEWAEYIHQTTGLVIDAYFSASKLKWLLDNVPDARRKAEQGELLFGTIDSWLIWKMTGGKQHVTDFTNASRTLLYDIHKLQWDDKLLELFDIPAQMLPEVRPSSGEFGHLEYNGHRIPISGVAGDQQAALFGQGCFEPGMAKNTYGTGCFMLMNTGSTPYCSESGLVTTIACGTKGEVQYALEGSIFIAGAAIQWLRDGLKILDEAPDSEYFAGKAGDTEGVYVVPAFAGLGAPYWDMYARGAIFGLSRDTGKEEIIKATLESLAYQTKDVLFAMEKDSELKLHALKVDGGASANNLLMQFQADILGVDVERPEIIESTAMGAAMLAGLGVNYWKAEELTEKRKIEKIFEPQLSEDRRERLYKGWQKAVKRSMQWVD